jgi:unsaturated rhamnogalacturonyl hydrolase
LVREKYLPVVQKTWQGLTGAVHPSGKVGWVQQVGSKPQTVSRYDTEAYGVGAFLLAGSEVSALIRSLEPALN